MTEWNDAAVLWPEAAGLHELVERQAARSPEAVAVTFEGRSLTYAELDDLANRWAGVLRGLGVGPETLVGVCLERSVEMVVALLSVLKAGGAYVPIDPSYPEERLAYMLDDSRVPVLLTQERLLAVLPLPAAGGPRTLCLDTSEPPAAPGRRAAGVTSGTSSGITSGTGGQSAAYAIYTSGSTGTPQGRRQYPSRDRQPAALDAAAVRPRPRGPRVAEDPLQLRRLGLGILLAPVGRRPAGDGPAGWAPGPGLSRPADPRRGGYDPALRPLDAPGLPGGAGSRRVLVPAPGPGQRRGAAGEARGALLRAHARGSRAAQPLRPHRGGGGRYARALRAGPRRLLRTHRPAGRQHPHPPAGPRAAPRARGGRRRAPHRRRAARARLPAAAGADGRALRAGPLRRGAGRPALQDGRPGAAPAGRPRRLPRPAGLPGEDPRLPHRAGGDRGGPGVPPGGPRGGGAGAERRNARGERHAAGGVPGGGRGGYAGRAEPPPRGEAAVLHGAVSLRADGAAAVDRQRQARPAGPAGAGPGVGIADGPER